MRKHVDAVEIDPTLQRFGAQHDPDHAYQDPRVTVHIDDGRAFLQRTSQQYDLILFALPDSLTLVSGASSLRLESYLFTLQAAQTARDHLAPDGAFAMYNFYREQWIVDRLAGTLDDAFGHAPCVYAVPQVTALAVLTIGRTAGGPDLRQHDVEAARGHARRPRPTTSRSSTCAAPASPACTARRC